MFAIPRSSIHNYIERLQMLGRLTTPNQREGQVEAQSRKFR